MKESGIPIAISKTEKATKYGQTVHSMKGTGKMERLMEEVGLYMLMETYTKDNGKTTSPMDLENINIKMEQNMKENG